MAYELVEEVLDHAPAGLTPAERLVMVAIAEYVLSSDYTHGVRRTSRPSSEIARRAGLKPDGLKAVLQRLAARNLELRVPLMTGKDNRPVYAMPGRSGTYEIPALAAATGGSCTCESCIQVVSGAEVIHKGGSQPPLDGRKGGPQPRVGGATAPPGGVTAPPGGVTAPPNRVRVPEIPGSRARASAKPGPEDLETIIEEMRDTTRKTVTREHAATIYRDVLERAKTRPAHPLAYVLKAIRTEGERYLPTHTPPAYVPLARQLPLVAVVTHDPPGAVEGAWQAAGTA